MLGRVEVSGLAVGHRTLWVKDGEHRADASTWQPAGAAQLGGSGVRADPVRAEYAGIETTFVNEVSEDRPADRFPQKLCARVDVANHVRV
jgi:hypothetical protein